MPGLFGMIGEHIEEKKKIFNSMLKILNHQSHYKVDVIESQNAFIGMVSVDPIFPLRSIIYENQEFIIGIDGYIFNAFNKKVDLSSINIEMFYHLLIKKIIYENQSPQSISGNYLLSIYNVNEKKMYLINDKIGTKSVYYHYFDNSLYFSQEAKAIILGAPIRRNLNWDAISAFFHFGYILGEDTFLENLFFLPSASNLMFESSTPKLLVKKYWSPLYTIEKINLDDAVDRIYDLLENSIEEKIFPKARIVNPISGGLDSRLILGILNELKCGENEKSFSIIPVTYAQKFSDEYKFAKQVCKRLKLENHSLIEIKPEKLVDKFERSVWLTDGFAQMNNAHLLLINEEIEISENIEIFNGIYGGPTNYAALYYQAHHITSSVDLNKKIEDILSRVAIDTKIFSRVVVNPEFFDSINRIPDILKNEIQKFENVSDIFANQRDAFFIENRMRRGIVQGALYKYFWKEHLPLSNYDLYDFYLKIPPEFKLNRKLLIELIKKYYPDLAKIKENNTGCNLFHSPGRLNKYRQIWYRNLRYYLGRLSRGKIVMYDKKSYAHYSEWLRKRNDFQSFYFDYLFKKGVGRTNLFDKSELEKLYTDVINGKSGYYHLMRIVTFSIFLEKFIL